MVAAPALRPRRATFSGPRVLLLVIVVLAQGQEDTNSTDASGSEQDSEQASTPGGSKTTVMTTSAKPTTSIEEPNITTSTKPQIERACEDYTRRLGCTQAKECEWIDDACQFILEGNESQALTATTTVKLGAGNDKATTTAAATTTEKAAATAAATTTENATTTAAATTTPKAAANSANNTTTAKGSDDVAGGKPTTTTTATTSMPARNHGAEPIAVAPEEDTNTTMTTSTNSSTTSSASSTSSTRTTSATITTDTVTTTTGTVTFTTSVTSTTSTTTTVTDDAVNTTVTTTTTQTTTTPVGEACSLESNRSGVTASRFEGTTCFEGMPHLQSCRQICDEVSDVMGALTCVSGYFFGETTCKAPGTESEVNTVQAIAAAAEFTFSFDGSGGKALPSAAAMETLLRKALANALGIQTTSIRNLHLTHPFSGRLAIWPRRAFSSEVALEIIVAEGQDVDALNNQVFNVLQPSTAESKFFAEVMALDGFSTQSVESSLQPHVLNTQVFQITSVATTVALTATDTAEKAEDNTSLIGGLIIFLLLAPCMCCLMVGWMYMERKDVKDEAAELSKIRI